MSLLRQFLPLGSGKTLNPLLAVTVRKNTRVLLIDVDTKGAFLPERITPNRQNLIVGSVPFFVCSRNCNTLRNVCRCRIEEELLRVEDRLVRRPIIGKLFVLVSVVRIVEIGTVSERDLMRFHHQAVVVASRIADP